MICASDGFFRSRERVRQLKSPHDVCHVGLPACNCRRDLCPFGAAFARLYEARTRPDHDYAEMSVASPEHGPNLCFSRESQLLRSLQEFSFPTT